MPSITSDREKMRTFKYKMKWNKFRKEATAIGFMTSLIIDEYDEIIKNDYAWFDNEKSFIIFNIIKGSIWEMPKTIDIRTLLLKSQMPFLCHSSNDEVIF